MSGKPISPRDVSEIQTETVPPEVFDAFNKLIAANWNGKSATVSQSEVCGLIRVKMESRDRRLDPVTVDVRWLNIEEAYRAAGWGVYYDKPGFNESYGATFTFTKAGE